MKAVQKSVRLSTDSVNFIEQYRGGNFNEKLGNLIEDYSQKRDSMVEDWNRIQAMCDDKKKELDRLRQQIKDYENLHWKLRPLLDALEEILPK